MGVGKFPLVDAGLLVEVGEVFGQLAVEEEAGPGWPVLILGGGSF